MKVAIVHDDLVQWGGAERVLLGLSEIYPDAPIYTSLYDEDCELLSRLFGSKKIITSFLQNIPGWRIFYKALLPFYGLAFEQFDFSEFDLVISHTTRFAKNIITKPATCHICYCHTPPRFLWRFSKKNDYGVGELLMTKLRVYDTVAACRVDSFIAGSENAKRRINKVYRVGSKVVYPFIDLERFNNMETFDGGYFVVISRLNKYKKVDLTIQTCLELGLPLKIIGSGPELNHLIKMTNAWGREGKVEFLGNLDDRTTENVLAGCRALIVAGVEDFGLTSLEVQSLGKPVVAFAEGGALETIIPNKTGIFFSLQSKDSLMEAINRLDSVTINPKDCIKNASRFNKENFMKNFQATVAALLYTN